MSHESCLAFSNDYQTTCIWNDTARSLSDARRSLGCNIISASRPDEITQVLEKKCLHGWESVSLVDLSFSLYKLGNTTHL